MKKTTKLLSVLVILCLCACFSGCESKEEKCLKNGGHDFKESSKTEATCTEQGEITYKCSKCGAKKEETIKATGHNYLSYSIEITKFSSCYEEGERMATCTKCGNVAITTIPISHTWNDATCISPKTCTVCGATEGEKSSVHTWQDATCTTPKTCKICGATEGEKSDKHSYNSDGVCTLCGAKNTRTITCAGVNFEVPADAVSCKYSSDRAMDITITDIKFERAYDSYSSFYVYFKSTCTGGSGYIFFNYKLYDSSNNVLSTGLGDTENLSAGETCQSDSFSISLQHVNGTDLTPGATYKLKIVSEY